MLRGNKVVVAGLVLTLLVTGCTPGQPPGEQPSTAPGTSAPPAAQSAACDPTDPQPGVILPAGGFSSSESLDLGAMAVGKGLSVSVSPAVTDEDGRDWQSASVTVTDLELTAEGKTALKNAGVKFSMDAGTKVTYGLTAPPVSLAKTDWEKPPNLFDPLSLAEGSSMSLDRAAYANLGLGASYRGIQTKVGGGVEVAVKLSVTRLAGSVVQVLAGEARSLDQLLQVGFGTDDFNLALVAGETATKLTLQQAEIDVSTPAGRTEYLRVVYGGVFDQATKPSRVVGSEVAQRGGIQIQLKDLTLGSVHEVSNRNSTVTTYPDGRQVEDNTTRVKDNTFVRRGEFLEKRERRPIDYQLRLRGVEPKDLDAYNAEIANQGDLKVANRQNLILRPTAEELAAIRQQALEIMAHYIRIAAAGGSSFTPPDGLGKDTDAAALRAWIDSRPDEERSRLSVIKIVGNYQPIEPLAVYLHADNAATLAFIFNGTVGEPTPAGSLDWLRTWNEHVELALGHPVPGFGSVKCLGATAIKPAEQPPADAGTVCGEIGGGYVAVVARGKAKCADAFETLKKYVDLDRDDETEKINGWSCYVLDGSFTETPSIYTVSHECESGENLIKAWPADSPLPKGYHATVKDFAGEFVKTGYPYHFATADEEFSCVILPPAGKEPGSIGCHGNFPKGQEERGLRLTRDAKPAFHAMGFPGYFRTKGGLPVSARPLPEGQVLAFYGVACTTGKNESVRCVNGEHEIKLRPGVADLS